MPQHRTESGNNPRRSVRRLGWIFGGIAVVMACIALRMIFGPGAATAGGPVIDAKTAAKQGLEQPAPQQPVEKPAIVAAVNGEQITRNDLAREALRHYGKEVLESLLNKHLISDACQARGITVTTDEVAAEIDRMAARFGVATDQWLKMLKEERNITAAQYAKDIIWPTIALRKLAADRCEPTELEVQQAYETQYGPSVRVRLIACSTLERAKHVKALAQQNPDDFPDLAKQFSDDPNSAAVKGLVPPVRKHLGEPAIEQAAFALRPHEISEPIPVGSQFIVLKCESHVPGVKVPWETVAPTLRDACRDKKLRLSATQVFEEVQKTAVLENVFNDPVKSQKYPGVAAVINGKKIALLDLAEECIERHGKEILEGTINRRLIEQAIRTKQLTVSEQDIEQEIVRAAASLGKTKPDGSPDVEAWIKQATEEQGITIERYRHDVVWPSVALKKLVGERIEVTKEDIQRGYEANYGERVRCRAIVCNQHRKALEVWEMARSKPTAQYFGDLAEQYSVEGSSRALKGEIPPIHKHSNQPLLEREAFTLRPGELSGVIQVDDKFVILFCEGRTTPNKVALNEVEKQIYEDVHEKKLRVTMAREFARLQEESSVDNFLANTHKSSKRDQDLLSRAAGPATVK
jgi:parvulin-like peptidyl-prolyl isomerase